MRVLTTFLANWRERAPYVTAWRRYARGRVAVRWHRVPWPQRAWESWQDTRRAERIAAAARADRPIAKPLDLRFAWSDRLEVFVHRLAFEVGRGFASGSRLPELEEELAAVRTNARVYEDQWRLTNEDLRRARVAQKQAEEYAIELHERLAGSVFEAPADPTFWNAAPATKRKRRWWQLWR